MEEIPPEIWFKITNELLNPEGSQTKLQLEDVTFENRIRNLNDVDDLKKAIKYAAKPLLDGYGVTQLILKVKKRTEADDPMVLSTSSETIAQILQRFQVNTQGLNLHEARQKFADMCDLLVDIPAAQVPAQVPAQAAQVAELLKEIERLNKVNKELLEKEKENAPAQAQAPGLENYSDLFGAFTVGFMQNIDYMDMLHRRIDKVAEGHASHYNYLAIIQSSGYGKSRAAYQLATKRRLIYVCFRGEGSSGFPPKTHSSDTMLQELSDASDMREAEPIANSWIESMINIFKGMYPENPISPDDLQRGSFWHLVEKDRKAANSRQTKKVKFTIAGENPEEPEEVPIAPRDKIVIFFDEASKLLQEKKKDLPFRAIRRALYNYRASCVGVLTDTNSSVADLAPLKERDKSGRTPYETYTPFVFLATTGCLRDEFKDSVDDSGHDIVRYGRPLWCSLWKAMANVDAAKFEDVVSLAKHKLTNSLTNTDLVMTQEIALAAFACTAVLFVSPVSTMAAKLVKSHMGTLILISDDRKRHLILYPSEPLLSEAALELLSTKNFEKDALLELDSAIKTGVILDAGDQGELVARLLFVSAWRRLICSVRENNPTTKVSFSVRRPVLDFLDELFAEFPRNQFPDLKDYITGFTHFIAFTQKPTLSNVKAIWKRRGALHFKRNQEGSDFAILIKHKVDGSFGAVVVQVKNYAKKQSLTKDSKIVQHPLSPDLPFDDDCVFGDKLGILLHIGSAYSEISEIEVKEFCSAPRTRSGTPHYALLDRPNVSGNRLIVRGLSSFKFSDDITVFQNLLRAWNEPILQCKPDQIELISEMIPCCYGTPLNERFEGLVTTDTTTLVTNLNEQASEMDDKMDEE